MAKFQIFYQVDKTNEFVSESYNKENVDYNILEWEEEYKNPVEMSTILGVFADNIGDFDMVMWISLDKGVFIKITPNNADSIIRYLYERYPY